MSPKGGEIPIGYIKNTNAVHKEYLEDAVFMDLLKNTFSPEQINSSNYKAVYYSGGGAAMFGVPENKAIQNISKDIYRKKWCCFSRLPRNSGDC